MSCANPEIRKIVVPIDVLRKSKDAIVTRNETCDGRCTNCPKNKKRSLNQLEGDKQ